MTQEPYEGTLNRKLMDRSARIAYESYCCQKTKCKNKNGRWFKYYGGKGLSVHYTAREFIGWWLHNLKTFKGQTPTVGRINHDKGYSFDNITMQDNADNSRESALRNDLGGVGRRMRKPVDVIDMSSGMIVDSVESIRETATKYGVSQREIQFCVRGKYKYCKKMGLAFVYGGGSK